MVKKLYEYRLALQHGGARQGLIVEWDGNFGEIAPFPNFSSETLDEAKKEALLWLRNNTPPTLPSVRFGIACAKRPLRSLRLPLASLGMKAGFSTVKLKIGHLSAREAISYVKEHLGKAHLRLDCNRKWSLEESLFFADHFQRDDFAYLEEPVEPSSLVAFSQITHFPIALDESIHRDWATIPSLKAIVVKPTIIGSLPQVPSRYDLVLSSSYESGLGLLHIASLAEMGIPVGLDTYSALKEDLLIEPIRCSQGYFSWNATHPPIDTSKLSQC